jgi:lipopolysaccharide/colanic/teichoic acid biosynthesis glycosyltransferase
LFKCLFSWHLVGIVRMRTRVAPELLRTRAVVSRRVGQRAEPRTGMLLPADSSAEVVVPMPTRRRPGRSVRRTPIPVRTEAGTEVVEWTEIRDDPGRRWLNVLVAAALLILAFPLMLLIAIAIKLTSKGPILYTQARVGVDRRWRGDDVPDGRRVVDYGGRLFRIIKFRTMHACPDGGAQTWAMVDDPRVTRLGRFLRKSRLDELPQMINVLMGDMNLVGPRPEQPRIFAALRERIPNYEVRQRVLPGITGWAQVNQSYDRSMEDVRRKLSYDLEYLRRQSWFEDLKIVLRTVPAVVLKRGGW